jgi:hypothetical protein
LGISNENLSFSLTPQYLCDSSPGSDMPSLLAAVSEAELCCGKLTICSEVVLLEIHVPPPLSAPPSELEQDSGRHIRQDSGNSGICSTEGGSTQQGCSCGDQDRPGSGFLAETGAGQDGGDGVRRHIMKVQYFWKLVCSNQIKSNLFI